MIFNSYFVRRVHLSHPDIVKIMTIDNQKPETTYLAEEQFRIMKEAVTTLASLIAETYFGTLLSDAILTANGYANKEALKFSLLKIETAHSSSSLASMLKKGAYIYSAIYKQEIVGVAVLTPITEQIPTAMDPPKKTPPKKTPPKTTPPKTTPVGEVPFPDPYDLIAVKTYAQSDDKNNEFMHQLRCNINNYLGHRDVDGLWELSGFVVKEGFRHQKIGRTLVKHAFSQVSKGGGVIIHAEPGTEAMYQHIGFRYAVLEPGIVYSVTLEPEWNSCQYCVRFPMMIFRKQ
ncbi:hypothetical protein F5Y12DRAFT_799448 [Xylaria sp. FL1777]|nr:hypothetical protein F5Y12DRAFT_799448 [Xylaria sp. FL1777]